MPQSLRLCSYFTTHYHLLWGIGLCSLDLSARNPQQPLSAKKTKSREDLYFRRFATKKEKTKKAGIADLAEEPPKHEISSKNQNGELRGTSGNFGEPGRPCFPPKIRPWQAKNTENQQKPSPGPPLVRAIVHEIVNFRASKLLIFGVNGAGREGTSWQRVACNCPPDLDNYFANQRSGV